MHALAGLLVVFVILHETSQQACTCPQNGLARPDTSLNTNQYNEDKVATPKKKCCPYNFDGKSCRYVNERVLCGYNTNKGVDETEEAVPYGDDCRIYKNRLECGYFKPPFTGLRRPTGGSYGALRTQDEIPKSSNEINEISKSSVEHLRRFAYRHSDINSNKCVEVNGNVVCL